MTLLECRALSVSYGGVRAVDDVTLGVEEGALVGLIGPNGAGKTTFIDALTGFVSYRGAVTVAGAAFDGRPPHWRARRGLARTFQSVELFDDLDVLGNLSIAATRPRWWSPLADLVRPGRAGGTGGTGPNAVTDSVARAVELLDIGHLLPRWPAELSEGERKLAGLCRALVGRPRLLLLDEPAAGLDTAESQLLGERLRAIVESGVTVLLVDHDMDLVLTVCDYLHVIEYGRLIAAGTPRDIRHDERVLAAYLGTAGGSPT